MTTQLDVAISQLDSAFPFTVDKLPLFGPENMRTPHYGLFRSDNSECLPVSVKRGFEPHTVDDIKALTEASVRSFDSTMDCRVTAIWTGRGHRVIVAPSREYRRSIFGAHDNLWPRMVIRADFGRAFSVETGYYRDACKNLAIARAAGCESVVTIRHTGSLRARMDQLIEDCRQSAARFENVVELSQRLERQRVQSVDFLAKLYPLSDDASNKQRTQHENRARKIVDRLIREAHATGRDTDISNVSLYQMLNAITGYVQHDKTRHGTVNAAQRAVMAVDDIETSAAWDATLAMLAS